MVVVEVTLERVDERLRVVRVSREEHPTNGV